MHLRQQFNFCELRLLAGIAAVCVVVAHTSAQDAGRSSTNRTAKQSQAPIPGKVTNFKIVPEWYTNQSRMKSLLEGAEAQPLAGNKALVKAANLQTFRESGEPELVVKTPECLYDGALKTVSSAATLRAQTANGKFSIEGRGFEWSQTNSSLAISNDVHTVLHPDMMKSGAVASARGAQDDNDSPVEVFARSFSYRKETGDGIYDGGVRIIGTNLTLTSDSLKFILPFAERQLQSITADQNVILDYAGVHATGARAVYTTDTGLVEVTGQPSWSSQAREGHADRVIIDRTNKIFHAIGNGWLKLPGQGLQSSEFLTGPRPDTAPVRTGETVSTNQFLEISASEYDIRTNSANFRGNVVVLQRAGEETRGSLRCTLLDVEFTGTNELRKLVASEDVMIEQGEARFTSQKAVYTATNSMLELTGNPEWRAGLRQGKGDIIYANLQQEEMHVRGRASMKFPASEFGQMALQKSQDNKPPKGDTNDFAEVFAEEYTLRPTQAAFRGGVYITHPQMAWASERITVRFTRGGGTVEGIMAERGVMFDLVDDRGQKLHGKGEKALYTYSIVNKRTNDIVELTGDPLIQTTNGTFRNSVIYLDRATGKLLAPGRYAVRGTATVLDTNMFKWPIK